MQPYAHDTGGDLAILTNSHPEIDDDLIILQEEVETMVKLLRNGKSTGADNIAPEIIKTYQSTIICNKICSTTHWPKLWTQL